MAEVFVPRTEAPKNTDKYWIHNGSTYRNITGINQCVEKDSTTKTVLPNCTGYAWGRVCELSEKYKTVMPNGYPGVKDTELWYPSSVKCKNRYLSVNNAWTWFPRNKELYDYGISTGSHYGWSYGYKPRLGAIWCGQHRSGGPPGHVAIVEEIHYDNNGNIDYINCSTSASHGYRFKIKKVERYKWKDGDGKWLEYAWGSDSNPAKIKCQGFIYPPYVALYDTTSKVYDSEGNPIALTTKVYTITFTKVNTETKKVEVSEGVTSDYNPTDTGITTTEEPKPVSTTFVVGDRVKVNGVGNNSAYGISDKIDTLIGTTKYVLKVLEYSSADYIIQLSNNPYDKDALIAEQGIGFFKPSDLEKI